MDDSLRTRLRAAVDAAFRIDNGELQPSWQAIHTTQGSPSLLLSRDPRAGERLTPVFFAACGDRPANLALMEKIYEGSGRLAGISQLVAGSDGLSFIAVPPMFHVVPIDAFVERVTGFFRDVEATQSIAWTAESCELLIGQHGYLFRHASGDDGRVRTIRAAVDAGVVGPWTRPTGDPAGSAGDAGPIHEIDRAALAEALGPLVSGANIFAANTLLGSDHPRQFQGPGYRWRLADLAVEVLRDHPGGLSATRLADQIAHREAAQGTLIVIDVPRKQVRTLDGLVPKYTERLINALRSAATR